MSYKNLLVEVHDAVGLIRFNRPAVLNALSSEVMQELSAALDVFERDDSIGAIVLSGDEKAFAAGADIAEMQEKTYSQVYLENFITDSWEGLTRCRKPVIAAVAGYALGGGCEVAMMCDLIIAADNAKFGQPEIKLGILPGAGGTQRLARLIGKARAMELCLTGRTLSAEEAERWGLVNRVVPLDELMDTALKLGKKIASFSRPVSMMVKAAVNKTQEVGLSEGVAFERQLFYATFATQDQKEGMQAFLEKRAAKFEHR